MMKLRTLGVLFALGLLSTPAAAQYLFETPAGGTRVFGTVVMCIRGDGKAVPCSSATPLETTGTGGGGGGGDASAANQTSQITQETAINTVLGVTGDAAATQGSTGTVSAKLRTVTSQLNTIDGRVDGLEAAIAALPQNNVLAAGTNNIGDVDVLTIAAGNNNIGDMDVASLPALPTGTNTIGAVSHAAAATGGCTLGKTLSAASTNATSVKGSAGTLCSLTVINTTATLYYLKFYDKATAATCNSDTVLQTIPVPASTTGAGVAVPVGPYGWAFPTGITFCLTGGLADNDNTSAATGVAINYSYK